MRIFIVGLFAMTVSLSLAGCATTSTTTAARSPKSKETKQAKDSKESKTSAAPEFLAAAQLEKEGKLRQARGIYHKLLVKDPKNPEYMHRLAVVYTRLKRYEDAASYYKRAKKLDPKNPSLLADYGYYFYLTGEYSEAESLLRESLKLKPDSERATYNLALVVGTDGDLEESYSLLKQVGSEAEALAGLAYIHEQRGDTKSAISRYREALAIDPDLKEASVAFAELIKNNPEEDTIVAKSSRKKTSKSSQKEIETALLTDEDEHEFDRPVIQGPRKRESVIQLAGSIADESPQKVVTAKFVEDAEDSFGPSLLKTNFETKEDETKAPAKLVDSEEKEIDVPEWDEMQKPPVKSDEPTSSSSEKKDDEDDWANN